MKCYLFQLGVSSPQNLGKVLGSTSAAEKSADDKKEEPESKKVKADEEDATEEMVYKDSSAFLKVCVVNSVQYSDIGYLTG